MAGKTDAAISSQGTYLSVPQYYTKGRSSTASPYAAGSESPATRFLALAQSASSWVRAMKPHAQLEGVHALKELRFTGLQWLLLASSCFMAPRPSASAPRRHCTLASQAKRAENTHRD